MKRIFKATFLVFLLSAFAMNVQAQRMNNRDMNKQQNPQSQMRAQGNQAQRGMGVEMRIPNLTDAQKEQIKTIRTNGQKEMFPVQNQLREKNAQLITLTTAEKYDAKAVNKVVDEISNLEKTKLLAQINHKQAIREVLTPEQRLAFDANTSRKRVEHKGRKAKRGMRGQGRNSNWK